MQSLNENLIRQKAKVDDIRHVRNLNVWGMDLVDIQILKRLPNLEVCSLSVNKIESLDVFEACPRLTELYLRKNLVADLSELYHLSHCPMLKSLWLSENPVARHPGYRLFAIKLLRNLQKLDDSDVSEGERRQAEKLSEREIFAGQLGGAGQPPPQQQQAAAPPPQQQQQQQQQQPSHASPPHHHPNREVHERPAHRPQPQHRHSPPDALPNAYNGDDVPVGAAVGGAAPAAAPALPAKERAVRAERDKQREVEERRAAAAHHEREREREKEREREREHHHAAARTPPQRHHQPPVQQQPHQQQQQQHPAQHRHREEQHDRDRQARHRHGAGQSPPPQYREREQYDRAPQQQRQEQRGGGYSHDRHDVHDRHHHPQQQHHHQAPPPPHHHHGDGHGHGHGHGPPRRHPSPDEAAMNDAQLAMVQSILSFLPHLGHRQLEMISLELQNLQQAQRRQASHS